MAIIEFNSKILVGKLRAEKIKDFGGIEYVFPGGGVEENENLEKAVIREAKEETGLNVKIVKLIGERVHPVTGKKIYYYHCQSGTDTTNVSSTENDDIESLAWVSKNKLIEYMPTLFPAVREYFENQPLQ